MRFPEMAREAILRHVPEARTEAAEWGRAPGLVWVRWQRADGKHVSIGLRRHLDWVTGEIGMSPDPVAHDALPLELGESFEKAAFRIRLGVLLHEEDRWWPVGETTREIREHLEGLVLQLRVRAETLGTKVAAKK
ncbi:MAG TPA: hypothetical protein VMJ70_01325 [Candidatus Sulfotelmatobacter sp.]|nr:hypothetical protein [Candidatus Sulfotelmatobacter sp.]